MKKPIIFFTIFLVLYIANLLILDNSGLPIIPSVSAVKKDDPVLLAKAQHFNPIPLNTLSVSPSSKPSSYVKPKVQPKPAPAAQPVAKAEVSDEDAPPPNLPAPKRPEVNFTKNTDSFSPNPPAGIIATETPVAPAPQSAEISQPSQMPVEQIEEPAPTPAPKAEVKTAVKAKEEKPKQEVKKQEPKKPAVTEKKEQPKKEPVKKEEKPAPKAEVKPTPAPAPAPKAEPAPAVKPAEAPKANTASAAQFAAAGLVNIEDLPIKVFPDIRYATTLNFTGKKLYNSSKCYLQKNVAQAFVKAVFYAQEEGFYFCIYDCYRPSSVQQIMWDKEDNGKFLSSPTKGSNHSRGAAIDLAPCTADGHPLMVPTGFDNFTDAAASNAKEGIPEEAIKNRTRLQDVMKKAGFSTIRNEWWHFDYKDAKNYSTLDLIF